ncbi:MFS transporter [Caballeronia sp. KNU42]
MTVSSVNVSELINARRLSKYQVGILLLCALAALMDGYDSVIIGITGPAIARSLSLDIKSFGPVFSAAQFGFMLGAFMAGPLADRLGRKRILVVSVVTFGLFSILTPFAESYRQLLGLRFITGLGLGGASTAFVAMCAEYSPLRVKARILTILWVLVPAGNVVGGLLSSVILPSQGWALVYYIGGVVPLVIAGVMIWIIPESLQFLVATNAASRRIASVIARVAPDLDVGPATRYTSSEARLSTKSVRHLFSDGRAPITLCIWISFFCCWLVLITLLAWTAPVLREAGVPIARASLMISVNSGGAMIGAPLIGWAMDRADRFSVVGLGLFGGAIAVAAIGFAAGSYERFMVCYFLAGALVGGTSAGMMALVATLYPTAVLSTGIGWAIGVARLGAIAGPTLFGFLLAVGWTLPSLFVTLGVLVLISALSIAGLRVAVRRRPGALATPATTA